jgi:RNase P subunit RPR2
MPIRVEHRAYYGSAWRLFRRSLIEAAGGEICTVCRIELAQGINGAHRDHNPQNPASVVLMCPGCHARHDALHRRAVIRRRRAARYGQLWLWAEVEFAVFA